MKRFFVLLITAVMLTANVYATESSSVEAVVDYGIIHGDPDGNLRLSDTITRAEFTKVIVAAASIDAASVGYVFRDVPKDHWAVKYIDAAYRSGIIAGMSEGCFEPDSPVTCEQAVKMIVCAWGYGIKADRMGGFPFAHMKIADELGILNGLDVTGGAPALRGDVIKMIYNALDIPLMQEVEYNMLSSVTIAVMDGNDGAPLITFRTMLENK